LSAIVSVPLRCVVVKLAVTVIATAPFPDPLASDTIDIQPRSDWADHSQPGRAVTVMVADPPEAPNVRVDADSVKAQGNGVGCVSEPF
jgi:hypothetical protein